MILLMTAEVEPAVSERYQAFYQDVVCALKESELLKFVNGNEELLIAGHGAKNEDLSVVYIDVYKRLKNFPVGPKS